MAEELAVVPTPKIPKGGQLGFKEAMGVQEPYLQRKAELQKGITAAEGDIAKATQAQSEVLQTGKMQAQEDFGAAQEGAMQGLQQKLEAEPLPAFIPTKDTAQDLAGLFSIVSVIGMIAGKQNGQLAMSAMNGMLDGYQKGRADLYKKQANEFDKNFKSMLSKHAEFRKEMEDAVKLASTNKEAGLQAAELAASKSGSSIVQAQLRKGDLVGAYNLVKESSKGADEAFKLEASMRQKAADRAAAAERARLDREAREATAKANRDAADAREKIRASATKGGGLKPGAKVTEAYIADNQLKADIQDITSDLKNNPSLVQKLEKYRIEAFLTEEGKVLNQVVSEDIPSDLRQFLTKVRDVRNNYYLNISGKAVTGGEALRSYGTVPQPGDSADGMVDKLNGMSKRVTQAIAIKQQLYGLPSLDLSAGGQTSLVPNENYPIADESSGGGEKIATPEDVEFTATQNNLTYEQTVQKLKERGYKIQGMKLDSAEGDY